MSRVRSDESGFALINVLVIVLALSMVALLLLQDARDSVDRVVDQRAADQAAVLTDAGVTFAAALLRDDLMSGEIDHAGEAWALRGFPAEAGGFVVNVSIHDLGARFNLNLMISKSPALPADVLEAMIRITDAPAELAGRLQARYAPFQPTAGAVINKEAETMFLAGDMTHASALAQLAGPEPRDAAGIFGHLSVLPRAQKVNVNTASEVVLAAITGMDVAALGPLMTRRANDPFAAVDDFVDAVRALAGDEVADTLPTEMLGVASHWFLVETEVRTETLTQRSETLLRRDSEAQIVTVFSRRAEVTG